MTDPRAPALAAMLRDRHRLNSDGRCRYCDESPCDALLLIAAIDADAAKNDAQATRLAAVERDLAQWQALAEQHIVEIPDAG